MHPQNFIPRFVTLAILSASLFAHTSLIAEEKRKIDLEKDKVYEHVIKANTFRQLHHLSRFIQIKR